ncbi:hypothetical protein CLF_104487 [Clonorchis sinensis]|uniref:Uncharacterized protein n=1 Tax=Clonorchis sinensis TaxID=79923 RepID=G7YNU7_CLOSI|nr:hypothetical protein CLF_104487 [Clonorchis sinensis]
MGQTSTKGNGYYTWSQNQPSSGGDKNICKQRLTREGVDSDEPDKDHHVAVKDKQIFSSTKRALTNWIVEEAPNYIVRVRSANKGKGYKDVHADLLSRETGITQNGNPVVRKTDFVYDDRELLLVTDTLGTKHMSSKFTNPAQVQPITDYVCECGTNLQLMSLDRSSGIDHEDAIFPSPPLISTWRKRGIEQMHLDNRVLFVCVDDELEDAWSALRWLKQAGRISASQIASTSPVSRSFALKKREATYGTGFGKVRLYAGVAVNPGKVHRPSLLRTSTANKNSDGNPNEKTNLIELTDEEEI